MQGVSHTWPDGGTAKEIMGARSLGALEIPVRKLVCTLRKMERHQLSFTYPNLEIGSCGLGVTRWSLGGIHKLTLW